MSEKKRVRFVQIVMGQMMGQPGATSIAGQWLQSWPVMYALADDGTVWMWSGNGGVGWMQCGPNPESADQVAT